MKHILLEVITFQNAGKPNQNVIQIDVTSVGMRVRCV
jgi:hypothetical protein